ncbi:hypothetical protein [Variovorax beijingensis]|uniref:hypothetical protein n=1 Tax=Variovorax beijingensis TaxID=2496117 RepID=UPI0039655E17
MSSPVKTLPEFVDYVRESPQNGNYGVPLIGGVPDIIGAAITRKANVRMEPIAFGGSIGADDAPVHRRAAGIRRGRRARTRNDVPGRQRNLV